jgi:hypothetical protein
MAAKKMQSAGDAGVMSEKASVIGVNENESGIYRIKHGIETTAAK